MAVQQNKAGQGVAASASALDGLVRACHTPRMIELTQEFGFDAAHYLAVGERQNRELHGHSFYAEVTLRGEPDGTTGVLRDFGEVKAVLQDISRELDHQLLNEVKDLGLPTLENLARFVFLRSRARFPEVVRVRIRRPSYGQSCVYEVG